MNNLRIDKKRPQPDSERLEQLNVKRTCIEVPKKDSNSTTARSRENRERDYSELAKKAREHSEFCEKQIKVVNEYVRDQGRLDWEKQVATDDLCFVSNLRLLINLIISNQTFDTLFISDTCYNIILLINDKCVPLRRTIDAVEESIKSRIYNKEAYNELFIDGLGDRYKNEKYERAKQNLLYLKNIQDIYIPYILYNDYKCLIIAKIILFWGDVSNALELFKRITESRNGIDKKMLKDLYRILSEYKDRHPFQGGTDNDLKEYYYFIEKSCGKKPRLVRNRDQSQVSENPLKEKPGENTSVMLKNNNPRSNGNLRPVISRTVSSLNLNPLLETEK